MKKNIISTIERLQPKDSFTQEVYDKPTDERLKGFNVGKLVEFIDRTTLIKGVVGGFSMSDEELVWVRGVDVKQHSRYRANNVEFLREIKIKKIVKKKETKKEIKKEVKIKVKEVKKNVKTKTSK